MNEQEAELKEYWFEITGKVTAWNAEIANEIIYRYQLAAYPAMKIKEINIETEERP